MGLFWHQFREGILIPKENWSVKIPRDFDTRKGYSMIYAYVIENQGLDDDRDNTPLFRLIRELDLHEDYVFIAGEDGAIEELLDTLEVEDKLLVLSVKDLAHDSIKVLLGIFKELDAKRICLCSINEPFLTGDGYLQIIEGFRNLFGYYREQRRQSGYQAAKSSGKVGRPSKDRELEQAMRLYTAKVLGVEEICKLTGISKSTLYRALK